MREYFDHYLKGNPHRLAQGRHPRLKMDEHLSRGRKDGEDRVLMAALYTNLSRACAHSCR
jgi:hypothetical protein